jgi:transposase
LVLDSELREQLESLANSRSLPAGLVRRAKIILLSASGKTNREIAGQLETSKVTVGLWRRRFLAQGVSGLYEELRPGRPRPISDERVAQLIRKTLKSKPKGATHPAWAKGKAEWTPFVTIKTSGYEQWLGDQVASRCRRPSIIWEKEDLSTSLQSRFDSLP